MREVISAESVVARATNVPASTKPRGNILRLKGNQTFRNVVAISPDFWGFIIHFDPRSRRSFPHLEDHLQCQGCIEELAQKNKWYLLCWEPALSISWIEFTDGAARAFKEQAGPRESFRGMTFDIHRTASSQGRLIVKVNPVLEREEKRLPQDESPEQLLRWLWNRENKK